MSLFCTGLKVLCGGVAVAGQVRTGRAESSVDVGLTLPLELFKQQSGSTPLLSSTRDKNQDQGKVIKEIRYWMNYVPKLRNCVQKVPNRTKRA